MASPVRTVTKSKTATSRWALVRYVLSAALARTADAGAAIGLLLLAVERSSQVDRPVLAGSILAAAIGVPHLAGPLVARVLDRARDSCQVLVAAMVAYGVFLGAAALLLGRAPLALVVLLVAGAGLCGPLLTGGLSSRLAGIIGGAERAQRRGEGWDALTYGLSGSVGPAVVAAIAAGSSALAALFVLVGGALVGAVLTLTLPRAAAAEKTSPDAGSTAEVLQEIFRIGALRRISVATMITSLATGGLAVLAVRLAEHLEISAASGATMMAAFGIGTLLGSLALTLRPLSSDPERVMLWGVTGIGVTVAACAAAGSLPAALVLFFLVGVMHAPYLAGSLGARSDYAPPDARAQVFVTVAALKIVTGAAGAPLVGLLSGLDPRIVFVGCGVLVLVGALTSVLDRRLTR